MTGTKSSGGFFDEMHVADGSIRDAYSDYSGWLTEQSMSRLKRKHDQADLLFRRLGITFTVYGEDEGGERLIPFDVIPRILSHDEWAILERGAIQRASHAWAEMLIDGLGWVSFDPANRQCATDAYIRLAVGLDYGTACPVRGLRRGGGVEELDVKVKIQVQ